MVPPPLCWPRTELGACSQGAVQAGQLKVPPGYHPLDVEKEWGKLHVAILEREKQLRSEFERWVAAGRGWGLVVAGKPPEGESLLPREEIPPQAGKPTPGPGPGDSGLQAGVEARSRRGPVCFGREPGGQSPHSGSRGCWAAGWSVFSAS